MTSLQEHCSQSLRRKAFWNRKWSYVFLEGSLTLGHTIADVADGIRHSFTVENDLLQMRASMLQHHSTALRAACPRTAAGCAAGGAAGCPGLWCRAGSLLCPRGCVPGQGLCRLPGSALSLPGELPRALRGDVWGEGAPRQGRGLLLPQLLPGAGGSQLHCTTRCFQMHFA